MRILIACLLVLLALRVPAQSGGGSEAHSREGDRHYQRMAYALAAREYRAAADMGALNEHVTKRLADCYTKLGDTENAEIWYAQVVKFLNLEPIELYNYAQALKSNAKYTDAEEWMDRYLAIARLEGQPTHSNITEFAENFTFGMDRYSVRSVSVNTPYTDMAPTWNGTKGVLFCSSRRERIGIRRAAAWNDQPFLDIYAAERQPDGDLIRAAPLEGEVNGAMHDGPCVLDPSGNTLWFTRNTQARSKNGVNRLSVLRARRDGAAWVDPQPFALNNPEISIGHPALSADGRKLFFVSDMPGGLGGTDIYMCRDEGGSWSEPVNLGPVINTPFMEAFPFMAQDGTLFFASTGLPGLGGLDIFAAKQDADGKFPLAINMGSPVNSPKDDFALILDPSGKQGYFTSGRDGGQGGDDIYAFTMHQPLEQRYLCTGTVYDADNGQPLIDVDVDLVGDDGSVLETRQTDIHGNYSFGVQKDREYKVVARMKGRFNGEQHLSTESIEKEQIVARDINLVPDAGIWLRGAVRYKDRLGFIEGMNVSVVNLSSFATDQKVSGPGGDVSFRLQANEEFEVMFEKPGFFSISVPVRTIGVQRGIIDLNEIADLSFEPMVLGAPIPLRHQKWAQASTTLDPIARTELDQLADRLQVNPEVVIEVAVHNDARGDLAKELRSSQDRADAIATYLIGRGVTKERITAKGYGATRLKNHCSPGVTCSEAEHAENRRVEWSVVRVGK
jgi:flagellar motor protein MotB